MCHIGLQSKIGFRSQIIGKEDFHFIHEFDMAPKHRRCELLDSKGPEVCFWTMCYNFESKSNDVLSRSHKTSTCDETCNLGIDYSTESDVEKSG